jgi:hypothetical protein
MRRIGPLEKGWKRISTHEVTEEMVAKLPEYAMLFETAKILDPTVLAWSYEVNGEGTAGNLTFYERQLSDPGAVAPKVIRADHMSQILDAVARQVGTAKKPTPLHYRRAAEGLGYEFGSAKEFADCWRTSTKQAGLQQRYPPGAWPLKR